MQADQIEIDFRWVIRRDLPAMVAIEAESFRQEWQNLPWNEGDFLRFLKERKNIGLLAVRKEVAIGFILYALVKSHVAIVKLAIGIDHWPDGVINQMLQAITENARGYKRSVYFRSHERNLPLQQFLKSHGFKADKIVRGYYGSEDAFDFVWSP